MAQSVKRPIDRARRSDQARLRSVKTGTETVAYLSGVDSRRRAEAELFRRLSDRPVKKGVNAYEALQSCLDDASHEYDFFYQEINHLSPQQIALSVPHRKMLAIVHKLRAEIEYVTQTMIKLGLDERVAAVKEAQLAMIVKTLDSAMAAAGVSSDQRLAIGRELKKLQPGQLEED